MAEYTEITFNFSAAKRMARLFPLLKAQVADMSSIFADVAARLADAFAEIWYRQDWAPLAPATIAARARLIELGKIFVRPASPILVETGRLYRSFTDRFHPDHLEFISADRLEYGSFVPYAIYHEEGTSKMPAREILVADILYPAASRVIEDAISESVRREFRLAA